MNWSHEEPAFFADMEAEYDRANKQASKIHKLEERVKELEAQLKSVLHILEANGQTKR